MAADGAPQTRDVGPLRLRQIMNAGAVLRLQHHRKLGQDQGARVCRQLFKLDDCTGHIGPQRPERLWQQQTRPFVLESGIYNRRGGDAGVLLIAACKIVTDDLKISKIESVLTKKEAARAWLMSQSIAMPSFCTNGPQRWTSSAMNRLNRSGVQSGSGSTAASISDCR